MGGGGGVELIQKKCALGAHNFSTTKKKRALRAHNFSTSPKKTCSSVQYLACIIV